MDLQSLLHRPVNVVLDCVTTEEHFDRECPTGYVEHRDVPKEHCKLVCIHRSRRDDKLQVFASRYDLQPTVTCFKKTI